MKENWKVGDIAICINPGRLPKQENAGFIPPLKKYAEYRVSRVDVCGCGRVRLDVGLNTKRAMLCTDCSTITESGIWWCAAVRFVKKEIKENVKDLALEFKKELELEYIKN
jgi:hypothetical protein